jgi:hypothetical protein
MVARHAALIELREKLLALCINRIERSQTGFRRV